MKNYMNDLNSEVREKLLNFFNDYVCVNNIKISNKNQKRYVENEYIINNNIQRAEETIIEIKINLVEKTKTLIENSSDVNEMDNINNVNEMDNHG